MKLSTKLMVSFSLITVIACLALVSVSFRNASNALTNSLGTNLKNNTEAAAEQVARIVNEDISRITMIAKYPMLKSQDNAAISRYFADIQKISKDITSITLVNLDGKIIAASVANAIGKSLDADNTKLMELFTKAKQAKADEVFFQDGYLSKNTGQVEIHFLTPILDKSNNIIAVLVTAINTLQFKEVIQALTVSTEGDKFVLITTDDGRILVSANPADVLFELPKDAAVDNKIKQIVSGNENGIIQYTDSAGDSVLGGYADTKSQGINEAGHYVVFSVAPVEYILAPVIKMRNILLTVAICVVLIVLILSFVIARSVTTPLNKVISRINEIAGAEGDLTLTLPEAGKDEISQLAKAFNRMLGSIRGIVRVVLDTTERVSASSQQLSSSAQEMSATTQEIASAVQQIAKGAQTQAQQVDSISSVIAQMDGSVKQVTEEVALSSGTSHTATQVAELGNTTMLNNVEKINTMYQTVLDSSKVVQTLGARSEQIGGIVAVITNIADQTNLLALNAAIEAARAGEAGRGFAVVADEVRKLAEGSAKAADQIADLVRSIQKETSDAVDSMELGSKEVEEGRVETLKASEALQKIIATIQMMTQSTQRIDISAQQMSKGTKQVVLNMEDLAATAEESAAGAAEAGASTEEMSASMEEVAAAAQELSDMAITLKETVQRFKVGATVVKRKG